MTFKTTMKGLNKLGQITLGDLGVHLLTFVALCVSLGIGLHKVSREELRVYHFRVRIYWFVNVIGVSAGLLPLMMPEVGVITR